jgi:hypothetical protein
MAPDAPNEGMAEAARRKANELEKRCEPREANKPAETKNAMKWKREVDSSMGSPGEPRRADRTGLERYSCAAEPRE